MADIVVDPGRLESALLKLGTLYGRGYLALHDADSRRFVSQQERARLRRRKAEARQKRARARRGLHTRTERTAHHGRCDPGGGGDVRAQRTVTVAGGPTE